MRGLSIVAVVLSVLAGIQVHEIAVQPAMGASCALAASPPNGVCNGANVALSCGTCNMWFPTNGVTWLNAATHGTVPGGWTPVFTPVACKTVTPCVGSAPSPVKTCPILGGLCRPNIDACTDYAAGAPVITWYNDVSNGPCTEV